MHTNTFPNIISAQNIVWADVPACVNHRTVAESGTNAYLGGVAERGINTNPSAAPEDRYASGPAMYGFAQVK